MPHFPLSDFVLGEEGELNVQMLRLAKMYHVIPNVEVSTAAPFSPTLLDAGLSFGIYKFQLSN